jgi:hypothetical protein
MRARETLTDELLTDNSRAGSGRDSRPPLAGGPGEVA